MYRNSRHNKILELIAAKQIETQEEIAEALVAEGYKVTQATVSRDIKDLGLIKISAPGGKQFYVKEMLGRAVAGKVTDIAHSVIISSVVSENMIVVKTMDGFGKIAKYAIEQLSDNLGCLADDDTVIVIFSDNASCNAFYKKLNTLVY